MAHQLPLPAEGGYLPGEALEDLVPFAEDVPVTDLDFEDETEGEGAMSAGRVISKRVPKQP